MRVIICGSRTWRNRDVIEQTLIRLPRPLTIVNGNAKGADDIATQWAIRMRDAKLDVAFELHPALWLEHGKAAGPIRNSEMAARGADLCIAFRANGRSPGTDDMVKKARAAGIPVEIVTG